MPIDLKNHSRLWKWKFRKEKLLLRVFLGRDIQDIQHVGSTAVPGLIAKPIVDMLATVRHFEPAYQCVDKIKRLGYEYKGANEESRFYFFVKGAPARYHLYLQESGADTWRRIEFRNILKVNPGIASRYAELKRTLVLQEHIDIQEYWKGKREFICSMVHSASKCHRHE